MEEADPDSELVERIGRGDTAAVREIVAAKLPRLLALATRMLGDRAEASDVAQDVFIRVWRHAARWRPGEARFDTWLHRVALNLCLDRLRRRHPTVSLDDPGATVTAGDSSDQMTTQTTLAVDQAPGPEQQLEQSDRRDRVDQALRSLPVRQREAIVLQHYQELTNVEAAELMGISIDAFESLLSRARRHLRTVLVADRPNGPDGPDGPDDPPDRENK